jgi:hypothetical protein
MGKNSITQTPSALTKFSIGFEYDRTWSEAKKDIKIRTHKE